MKKQALIAKESKATAAAITTNSNPNETNETHKTFNVRIRILSCCLFNNIHILHFLGYSTTFKCW